MLNIVSLRDETIAFVAAEIAQLYPGNTVSETVRDAVKRVNTAVQNGRLVDLWDDYRLNFGIVCSCGLIHHIEREWDN